MPYRHAHWYILALFPLAGLAFWRDYLSQIATASMEFHAHGITASLWLLLLAAQSWTIQHGKRQVHRMTGMASLALFPLFLVGGVAIFFGSADRYVAGSPFHVLHAANLFWLDVVSIGGIAYLYYQGLRQRRKVHPHSGYMLSTVFFLLPPILGRLSAIPMGVSGPETLDRMGPGIQYANLLTAAIAFFIAWRRGKHGQPFVLAGILTLLAALLFQLVGDLPAWEALFARLADVPVAPFALAAGVAGAIVAYAGWVAGRRAVPPSQDPLPA